MDIDGKACNKIPKLSLFIGEAQRKKKTNNQSSQLLTYFIIYL
jgi:hypothetical protein